MRVAARTTSAGALASIAVALTLHGALVAGASIWARVILLDGDDLEIGPDSVEVALIDWEPESEPGAESEPRAEPEAEREAEVAAKAEKEARAAEPKPDAKAISESRIEKTSTALAMRRRTESADPRSAGWIAASTLRDRLVPIDPIAGRPGEIDPLAPIAGWRARPPSQRSELSHRGDGNFETDGGTYTARTSPDGTVDFEDEPSIDVNLPGRKTYYIPMLWGTFDVTDAVMRRGGEDPYSAKKLAFLDRTREERAKIGADNHRDALRQTPRRLRRHLASIHARADLAGTAKRALYFELWDEALESGHEADVKAAESARATIVSFIRKQLPRGSADAYSEAELARLNARRTSRRKFAPY